MAASARSINQQQAMRGSASFNKRTHSAKSFRKLHPSLSAEEAELMSAQQQLSRRQHYYAVEAVPSTDRAVAY